MSISKSTSWNGPYEYNTNVVGLRYSLFNLVKKDKMHTAKENKVRMQ